MNNTSHLLINGKELIRRTTGAEILDTGMPRVTGVRVMDGLKLDGDRGDEYEGRLDFTQTMPLPMTILSIEQELEV